MGRDLKANRRTRRAKPRKNFHMTQTRAALINQLLDATGFKGSVAKRVAYELQKDIEPFLPKQDDG
jgi:hypothetical protein